VPVTAAAVTVTGDVPIEVTVNVFVTAVFTATLPKLRFVAVTVNCGLADPVPRVTLPKLTVPLRVTKAMRTSPHPLNRSIFAPEWTRCPFCLKNSRLALSAVTWIENHKLEKMSDTNLTFDTNITFQS
jgi:hypothetical protein